MPEISGFVRGIESWEIMMPPAGPELLDRIRNADHIVAFTGAGVSAEIWGPSGKVLPGLISAPLRSS